ncbi:hypothetical protein HPB50_013272 [Hyalomma asiaticum]|uniref:Uncharacterized protein n=1 Tax=Hyalomma asiaticum TaxID=266040 RepID=A0ACB7T516_HYAAI|nr:hypothetical protein HPB50_013272 [Hyalomma asiaticum]
MEEDLSEREAGRHSAARKQVPDDVYRYIPVASRRHVETVRLPAAAAVWGREKGTQLVKLEVRPRVTNEPQRLSDVVAIGRALQMARKGRASLQHIRFPIHIASGRPRGANATARSYSVRYARLRLRMMSRRPTLVRIYQLLEPGCDKCERRLINIRRLSRKGRHRMDVAEAVQSWIDQPDSNHGLDIECKPACRLSRDSALDVEVAEVLNRSHRSYRNGPAGVLLQHHRAIDCSHGPDNQTDLCCRHSLKVSFAEIGWHWVAEPKEFDAYMCKGRCPNDNRNFNSTHALVQSLMSERADVPSPCCAPKSLKGLSLLYQDGPDSDLYTVATQQGMVVEECACL